MDKPLFSIIIPCYNSASIVGRAITSVLEQSYSNLELILINDGSTDNTLEVLKQFGKDSRVRIFSKANGKGYCSAINYGMDKVKGDYFLNLGEDDYLDPELLMTVVTQCGNDTPDLIAYRMYMHFTKTSKCELYPLTTFHKYIYDDKGIVSFCQQYPDVSEIFAARDTAKIYKTSLLGNLRLCGFYGYDADNVFALLFSHRCTSFSICPADAYHCTIRPGSISSKKQTSAVIKDRLIVAISLLDALHNETICTNDIWNSCALYKNIYIRHNVSWSLVARHPFLLHRYGKKLRSFWVNNSPPSRLTFKCSGFARDQFGAYTLGLLKSLCKGYPAFWGLGAKIDNLSSFAGQA